MQTRRIKRHNPMLPPFGYRLNQTRTALVVYEPEARILRRIFEWAAQGVSGEEISKRLNDEGIIGADRATPEYRDRFFRYMGWPK